MSGAVISIPSSTHDNATMPSFDSADTTNIAAPSELDKPFCVDNEMGCILLVCKHSTNNAVLSINDGENAGGAMCGSAIFCRTIMAIPPFTSSSSTATSAVHFVCPCCMVLPPTACTSDANDDVNIFHSNDGTHTSDHASFVDSGNHCHTATTIAMSGTGAPIVPPDKADDSNIYGQILLIMLANVDSKLEAVLPSAPNIAPSVLLSMFVPPGLATVNTNGCSILVATSTDLHSTLLALLPTTHNISAWLLPSLSVPFLLCVVDLTIDDVPQLFFSTDQVTLPSNNHNALFYVRDFPWMTPRHHCLLLWLWFYIKSAYHSPCSDIASLNALTMVLSWIPCSHQAQHLVEKYVFLLSDAYIIMVNIHYASLGS
jgi:hypothetical protein